MALRGQRNSQSLTLVSGSTPPITAVLALSVIIRPPMESPYTGRVATLVFDWVDNNGRAADVTGFGIGSLRRDPGGELFNFTKVSDSRYTAQVRFQKQTGPWTITVLKDTATLISDPNVTGPIEDTSATIQLGIIAPTVNIGVPAERPITQRPVPLTFDWVYTDGTPAPVETFDLTDIDTDVGTLENFQQVTGDPSRYTAELAIPEATTYTTVTITVSANSAEVVNSNPAVLGPLEDTSRTFEIAPPTAIAMVTGADTVCVLEKDIIANDYLNEVLPFRGDAAGGAFTGVFEPVAIGDYVYYVTQIRKFTQTVDEAGELVTPTNPANFLSDLQAGAALVRVNTATCQFELLKAYSDITLAARSLAVDGETLYFFEGSHYMYEDGLIFSDPQWREKIGYLYKIEHPSSTIQEVGLNWRSATTTDNPDTEETDYFYGIHGGTTAPIAIVDDVIHLITGFGNFDDIGQPRGAHPVNRVGNWNWIQYGNKINQRLSEVFTNGRTGFDVLKDIAIVTNSIIGFKNGTFFLRPREPQKAINGGGSGITATQTTLTADDLNWGTYPSEGYLLIGSELIKHSGADANGQFSDLVRGAEGTTAAAHTGKFEITFVDHILSLNQDTLEMPIKKIGATNDNRQFYNYIVIESKDGDAFPPVEDTQSIMENGFSELRVRTLLDEHQSEWAKWLANSYLARFKDVHQVIQPVLKPSPYLFPGEVVYLDVPERMHLDGTRCQLLEIRDALRQPPTTAVKLVTL